MVLLCRKHLWKECIWSGAEGDMGGSRWGVGVTLVLSGELRGRRGWSWAAELCAEMPWLVVLLMEACVLGEPDSVPTG